MQPNAVAMRTILIDDEVFEVISRIADARDTDANGALKYLLELPAVTLPLQNHERQ